MWGCNKGRRETMGEPRGGCWGRFRKGTMTKRRLKAVERTRREQFGSFWILPLAP